LTYTYHSLRKNSGGIWLALGKGIGAVVFVCWTCVPALSTDLTIRIAGDKPLVHRLVLYSCDGAAGRIGLPAEQFPVEYVSGAGNNLAVVPIRGVSLIFSNISSKTAAVYRAQQFAWTMSGRNATLVLDTLSGKRQSTCHETSPD
jgi:membrane-bound inhibitor of C-type lysozyme